MKRIIKNRYIIATILCIIIYMIYLKTMSIYPFGEYSILKSDLYQQYLNFFCYLKQVILNGKSIIISWNMGLSNYFYTTFAYYLISPLNLLVIFFNNSNIDIFVEIITLIKLVLITNSAILYFEKSYNYKNKEAILFGLIYAYSSYTICYSFHIMWLDCLYMFPIVLLSIDNYLKTNKIWPFIVSLSFTILTNYYMGYMVALFSGIYFLLKCYIHKVNLKKIFKFLIGIVISTGIGMIVILPSIEQLGGKMNSNVELIKVDIEKIKLLINVLFNNYVYMFTQKSGFMFSSTLIIILIPLYYLNKEISSREKIGFSIVIIFLLLPIISPFLNKMWHAFTTPNCFNYRYSFIMIFILITMGAREFQCKKATQKKHFVITGIIFILLTLVEIVFKYKGYLISDNYTVTINSIILSCTIYIIMYILTYYLFQNKKIKKSEIILFSTLCLVVILDLIIGAKSGQNNNDKYFKRETVNQHNNFMTYFMKKIQMPETERIVFEPDEYGNNMSLRYGYSNIGYFTSARNRKILKCMYRLGYNVQMDEQLWITSCSGTFLNYSIAGVKYYISKKPIDIYGFEFNEKYLDYYIYRNINNFEIGYYLKNNIEESYNPFKMQNELLNGLNGRNDEKKFFEKIENSEIIEKDKNLNFDKEKEEYKIEYTIKAKIDCTIYLASDYDLQVYIDNKPLFENYSNIWSKETGIKQIKHLKQNETFKFMVKTKQNLDLLYIYVSNNYEIQKALNSKEKNNFTNIKIKKNALIGEASFENEGYLVFSIAYDKNWKIYADGKKMKSEPICGCFLGVKLNKGKHKIEIKY